MKCGVLSLKFGVRRVQCEVWSVECEDFASSFAEKIKRLSREGHGWDRVSLNYRSFMFGKLPPPACPGLCLIDSYRSERQAVQLECRKRNQVGMSYPHKGARHVWNQHPWFSSIKIFTFKTR